MQQYAVVFFLNTQTDKMQQFRKKYDPMFHIIPPHITLLHSIESFQEEQLIHDVKKLSEHFHPFPLHLTGLTKTQDNCLFLLVDKGKDTIEEIHRKFLAHIPTVSSDAFPFKPHVTLSCLQGENSKLQDIYKEAEKMAIDILCTFTALTIIKGDGIHKAENVATINLV